MHFEQEKGLKPHFGPFFAVLGMVKMLLCVMWDEQFVVTLHLPYYTLESQVD